MKLSWAQLSPPGPWSLHNCGKACVNRGDILYIYTHTRIADSLCCIAEINTTLHNNYTPIQKILIQKKERKAPVPPSLCTKSSSSYPPSSLGLPSGQWCWQPPGDEMGPLGSHTWTMCLGSIHVSLSPSSGQSQAHILKNYFLYFVLLNNN